MKILLIDNGTTLLERLRELIPGNEAVMRFDEFDEQAAKKADIIILSGSSVGPVNFIAPRFKKEIAFIKETNKPLIGICFGLELIVRVFGGTLRELPVEKSGTVIIRPTQEAELFRGLQQFSAYEKHRFGIDVLPEDFEVLAISEHGPEIIRHKSLPIYGFQFHPENLTERHFGDEIFLQVLKSLNSA